MSMQTTAIDSRPALQAAVNLDSYPLERAESARLREVIARCRAALDSDGCSVLPEFFGPGLAAMQAEAAPLAPLAYFKERFGNPYSSPPNPSLPADHPVRAQLKRNQGFVAGDQIAESGILKRIYRDPLFRRFVGQCLGLETIHEYADPLGCLVVNVIREGAEHPWHFDTNEFVVSAVVQAPAAGGQFEYCPNIRSPQAENFDRVGRVLRGDNPSEVRTLALRPGDMQLFRGRYSLHRVSRVTGPQPRLSVIFSYTRQAGMIATAQRTRYLFGRSSHCHEVEPASRADALLD